MTVRLLAAATAAALLLLGAMRVDPMLGWLVCAPLVAASLHAATGFVGAAALGAAFALEAALAAHGAWLCEAAQRYFLLSPAVGAAAAVGLCVACAGPLGALLGVGLRCAAVLPRAWPILASAAIWVTWETLARMVFPYYPWIGLAVTQADAPATLQLASLAGQGGLSLVLAAVGCALGYAVHDGPGHSTSGRGRRRARWWPVGLAALLVVATVRYGAMRLAMAGSSSVEPICSLAAVDAKVPDPRRSLDEVLERYGTTSTRAAAARPDLIVWPESALPRDPLLDGALLLRLRDLARAWSTVIVAGGPHTEWNENWRPLLYNSAFRIAADGPLQVYDKREPVPFAEVWPTRLVARPAWLASEDVAVGGSAQPMRVGACRLGILICFEIERPTLAARYAAQGADALVVLSNDAQLPARAGASEVAEARLRAVETGLPVLRAANLGASVAIDRYGRVEPGANGVVSMSVPAAKPAPAVRWANVLLVLCALTAAATVLAAIRHGRPR